MFKVIGAAVVHDLAAYGPFNWLYKDGPHTPLSQW